MKKKYNSLFLIPYPQFIKEGRGRILLDPEARIVLSEYCQKNKIIRSIIQEEIIKKLGVKIKIISEKQLTKNDNKNQIFLDIFTLKLKTDNRYELTNKDFQVLDKSYGQGYIIKTDQNLKRIFLIGSGYRGLMYALITLKQLLYKNRDNKWVIPEIYIRDYPDFKYRALDWLLNAECNRWVYDWGDGRKKFIDRIKRRLDICLSYKINMIHFDGIGWDINRFPGYAGMMQEFNSYARARGISLIFGGYGGGYGATYQKQFQKQGVYWGKVFYNRLKYPSGRIYPCQGNPFYKDRIELSKTLGTCLSNSKLRELFCEFNA